MRGACPGSTISAVTDEVLGEVIAWQQRPLDPSYPVVSFNGLRVKIRDEGTLRTKAGYLALGITTGVGTTCAASGSNRRKAPGSGIAS